jgi:hypothetical protein
MDQAPDVYFHVIQQIKTCKQPKSRVACLGDAPTPMTGIGTSMTLIMVYVLAGELSKLMTARFQRRSRPTKALVAYLSKRSRVFHSFSQLLRIARLHGRDGCSKAFTLVVSRIMAIPWVAISREGGSNIQGFQLPQCPNVEDEGSK